MLNTFVKIGKGRRKWLVIGILKNLPRLGKRIEVILKRDTQIRTISIERIKAIKCL